MKSQQEENNMKIQHTTHEESRSSRPLSRPASATKKIKDYFSAHLSRLSDQGSLRREKSVTTRHRSGHITPSADLPDITAPHTQQRRSEKVEQRGEEPKSSSESSGNCLPLRMKEAKVPAKQAPEPIIPKLRHKGKFSVVRDKLSRASSGSENNHADQEHNLDKLHKLQRAIKDGRLELVVPRCTQAEQESRFAPPRSTQNPFLDPLPATSIASKNSKAKSASSKVAGYIGTSADILDETRRDLQGKFCPPFEYLSYPTFSLSRKTSLSSGDSDESFYCQGEEEEERDPIAVPALNARQNTNSGRRLSGEGKDPWIHGPPAACKLCRKPGVSGIRGLCDRCERDFMRPKAPALGLSCDSMSSSEGIRPTPPLKDRKTRSTRKPADIRKPPTHTVGRMKEDLRPRVLPEDDLKMASADKKPIFHNPTPARQISQRVDVEEDCEDDERYRRWQTRSMKLEFERTRGMFERWSNCPENGDCGLYEVADDTPLIEGGKDEDAVRRHSSFYGFWDEVLKGPGGH